VKVLFQEAAPEKYMRACATVITINQQTLPTAQWLLTVWVQVLCDCCCCYNSHCCSCCCSSVL